MRVLMIDGQAIRQRWDAVSSKLDERGRRLFAAAEVRAAGRGGLAAVSGITGLARSTLLRGLKDLEAPALPRGRVRRQGGGRRRLAARDAGLLDDLRSLVEPATVGDPVRPLLWVSKSLDKLASALDGMGHTISPNSVRKLLTGLGFSRQSNRKADEGAHHPDRNAQFEHINGKVLAAQAAGQPVISVDTKKKELVGAFRNGGSDYRPKVSVGITHDTAAFAVAAIRQWLERMGRQRYPDARALTIAADCPGTSKWNKIEHRLFCYITQNWRARPLVSRMAVVELIAATTTKTGLRVESALDERTYEKGIKISNAEMKALDICGDKFHPEWNYTINPRTGKT